MSEKLISLFFFDKPSNENQFFGFMTKNLLSSQLIVIVFIFLKLVVILNLIFPCITKICAVDFL